MDYYYVDNTGLIKTLLRGEMNQYPTLFLSFKDVYGSTFENAFNFLKYIVAEVCKQHMYLLDRDDVDIIYGAFFILSDILQKQGNVMQRDWLS